MALKRFDVTKHGRQIDLLLVYQSDFLDELETRLVVPLLLDNGRPFRPITRLNPRFSVEGRDYFLWTQHCFTARVPELGAWLATLEHEQDRIRESFDFLTNGF